MIMSFKQSKIKFKPRKKINHNINIMPNQRCLFPNTVPNLSSIYLCLQKWRLMYIAVAEPGEGHGGGGAGSPLILKFF